MGGFLAGADEVSNLIKFVWVWLAWVEGACQGASVFFGGGFREWYKVRGTRGTDTCTNKVQLQAVE